MNAVSGWDLLDSILASLPLGLVVYVLALIAQGLNPAAVSGQTAIAVGGFMVALQFAYQMNQLVNPRYSGGNGQSK